jgi:nucleoside-diphosphate-sugar epimerase
MWIGRLDAPHSLSYAGDVARGLITLGEHDEALGGIWHIPAAEALTGRQFLQLVFEEAGLPPKIGVRTRAMMRLVSPFMPVAREALETLYQFEAPFVVDGGKFMRAFGFAPTPHREAIRQTLTWFRER